MKDFENTGNKELIHYLNHSIEALRKENLRLMDEVERLTNNIDIIDAEYVSNFTSTKNYLYNLTN